MPVSRDRVGQVFSTPLRQVHRGRIRRYGVTTIRGPFGVLSVPNVAQGLLVAGALSTSVTTLRPAANSAWRKLVRSTSYHCAVVPVTVSEPRTVPPAAGLLFHVSPPSVHVLAALWTLIATLGAVASLNRPNNRSLALLIVARLLRSNCM